MISNNPIKIGLTEAVPINNNESTITLYTVNPTIKEKLQNPSKPADHNWFISCPPVSKLVAGLLISAGISLVSGIGCMLADYRYAGVALIAASDLLLTAAGISGTN